MSHDERAELEKYLMPRLHQSMLADSQRAVSSQSIVEMHLSQVHSHVLEQHLVIPKPYSEAVEKIIACLHKMIEELKQELHRQVDNQL